MIKSEKTRELEPLRLSVIVPVFGTEQYVGRCLESLAHQTYKNIEIIIVNDGSKGELEEIVYGFQEKFSKEVILVTHKINQGLFLARCSGMLKATGDYFAFLDSDDCVPWDYYRVLMEKAVSSGADIVAADHLEAFEDGTYYAPHNMLSQKDWDLRDHEIIKILMRQKGLDYGWWVVWNKVYARHIWMDSLPIIQTQTEHLVMCEDIAFSVNFFVHAKHLANVHNNYYYYFQHKNASTIEKCSADKYKKKITDIIRAFSLAKAALETRGLWNGHHTDWQLWKNRILSIWKNTVLNDESLSIRERTDILKILSCEISSLEEKRIDTDTNFCARGSKWSGWDLVADTKRTILSEECKVVSFDIFDTLLLRPFERPTDLFVFMEAQVNTLIHTTDYVTFSELRIRAEQLARQRKAIDTPLWNEVSINDIYAELETICPALHPYIPEIKQLEIDQEIKLCSARKLGKEYLECAIAGGKRVVCTSDIYLPLDVIERMLKKVGYTGISKIYLSSDCGCCKWNGKLFRHVLKEEKIKHAREFLHIGDDWNSDILEAEKLGIVAKHLPKTIDIFRNGHGGIYSGQYYFHCFQEQKAYIDSDEARRTFGVRTMMGMVANKLYDNPFVMYLPDSDFNADIYTIGYFCLGMHLYAIADWLCRSIEEEKVNKIHFFARDGYLPKLAFDILNSIYKLPAESYYTYMSRKAVLPLMIQEEKDFCALFNNFELNSFSPKQMLDLTRPILKDNSIARAKAICRENGIAYEGSFDSIEGVMRFGQVFFKDFYSSDKAQAYKSELYSYLENSISCEIATFDVGYSLRIESILAKSYNCKISAHYIHTNNDRFYGRMESSGVHLKTLYPNKPFITGIMRELPLSELGPSCIGYQKENGSFQPLFEQFECNIQTEYLIHTMQEAALDFVGDMVQTFGNELRHLSYRINDACLPFEYFLHYAKQPDRDLFRGIEFEDDLRMGNGISFVDFWNQELWRWGSVHDTREDGAVNRGSENHPSHPTGMIDYNSFGFMKRWMLIYILDWEEGKQRVKEHLKNHPVALECVNSIYHFGRRIYRKKHPNGRTGR